MNGSVQLVLAIVTQIAVVGGLFLWMFRKDRWLKHQRLVDGARRGSHGS
jgi:hypothetical protein